VLSVAFSQLGGITWGLPDGPRQQRRDDRDRGGIANRDRDTLLSARRLDPGPKLALRDAAELHRRQAASGQVGDDGRLGPSRPPFPLHRRRDHKPPASSTCT
jgi:hypothetical protein